MYRVLYRAAQMVLRGPERRAQGAIGTQVPSSLLYKPPLQDEPAK